MNMYTSIRIEAEKLDPSGINYNKEFIRLILSCGELARQINCES